MALSPENTHLLEQLADNVPEGRRMIISAWTMLSRRTGERPDTPDSAQRIFEASAHIPSLTRGVDGEPVIRIVEFYERMALNLSRTALSISIAHTTHLSKLRRYRVATFTITPGQYGRSA